MARVSEFLSEKKISFVWGGGGETVLMWDHKLCFYEGIWLIILKLSLLLVLSLCSFFVCFFGQTIIELTCP